MKYLVIFLALFAVAVILSIVLRNKIIGDTPAFIIKKLEELKENRSLMDSVGEDNQFEFSYNENDFNQKDTVFSKILLIGSKGTLEYQAVHFYRDSTWILKRDTITIISK